MTLGDFDAGTVVYGKFTTFRPSTGAAYTLGGTPALSVYKDNSTTQSTTGVTLTADFDSVTGLNHFAIDTSADGTFYSAGSFFDVVITTGTVDGVSVVGAVVGRFSIEATSMKTYQKLGVNGVCNTGATTTSIPTSSLSPAASAADQFKGRTLIFAKDTTTAALRGQATDITASTAGGTLTVTALTTAPASGDTFKIV